MIRYVIVHHCGGTDENPKADSSRYTVSQCNTDHKVRFNMKSSLGWYVGYTYYIDFFGKVTQCRKEGEEGAHCKGYNSTSIGICLAGNFDVKIPSEAQKKSLTSLLNRIVSQYKLDPENVVPHRKFAKKSCFGNRLPDDWAQDLIG